jgi:hypothetical protein
MKRIGINDEIWLILKLILGSAIVSATQNKPTTISAMAGARADRPFVI